MKKIKQIYQTVQSECGLCCISMLASYYGFYQPISYYRSTYEVGRDGIGLKNMHDIVESLGFDVSVLHCENISDINLNHRPYIVYLKNDHFVVLIPISKDIIKIHDPSKGTEKYRLSEFDKIYGGYIIDATPNSNFHTTKNKVNDFRHLFPLFQSSKKELFIVTLTSLLSYIISLFVPLTLQGIINKIISKKESINAFSFTLILVITTCFLLISQLRNHSVINLQMKLYDNTSIKTIQHLFNIPYSYFDNRSQGNILYRMNFLGQLQSMISTDCIQILIYFTSILVVSIYLCSHYLYLLPFLVLTFVLIGLIIIMANRRLMPIKQNEIDAQSIINNMVTESIGNMFQIKCMHMGRYFLKTFDNAFINYKDAYKNSNKKTMLVNSFLNTFSMFLPVYILLSIIVMPIIHTPSIGELFAIYSLLGIYLNSCMTFFTEIFTVSMLKPSLCYINDLLDEKEEEKNLDIKIKEFNNLNLNNISFKYNDSSNFMIKDVSISVKKGTKIAIVGLSGSGKTTLVKLLAGLYKPNNGSITINDLSVFDLSDDSFGNIISIVPQISIILNRSIKDNITLEDTSITNEQVIWALKVACLYDEVLSMPMGLHTVVSGQGGDISGGQVQRLALARAVVRKPQLLILDESTSSLDIYNENKIYENLKIEGISTLVISHRLATIISSDQIYVLDNGELVEQGTHMDLMCKKGKYYSLFTQQNNGDDINESICI